jgi:hypothetical protein
MSKVYAIEVLKGNLALIQMLNEGGPVKTEKKKTWFVFEVSDTGKSLKTDILTERELFQTYDVANSPFVIRLKKA